MQGAHSGAFNPTVAALSAKSIANPEASGFAPL
jgi:hypothetical protein